MMMVENIKVNFKIQCRTEKDKFIMKMVAHIGAIFMMTNLMVKVSTLGLVVQYMKEDL